LQRANATARRVTHHGTEGDLTLWRIQRLQAAIDRLDAGNLNAFGRRMGFTDGSYVGQMLRGTRPITEKFVRKLESIPQMDGWFDPDQQLEPTSSLDSKVRAELLQREVPEHVLLTILDLLTHCPLRRKVA
jgi:hypothetical protein